MRELALVGLAGCNWFYGLEATKVPDAAEVSPPDALPANCRVALPSAVEADTYLLDNKQHGVRRTAASGFDVNLVDREHPALFMFLIGDVQPNETIVAASLSVVVVDRADECGAPCGVCAAHAATTYRVYWNRSDWSDDHATDTERDQNSQWDAAFATGVVDRSELVVEAPLPAALGPMNLGIPMVDVARTPATPWILSGALTIQLTTDTPASAPVAIAADDRDESTCADSASKAQLQLTVCTP